MNRDPQHTFLVCYQPPPPPGLSTPTTHHVPRAPSVSGGAGKSPPAGFATQALSRGCPHPPPTTTPPKPFREHGDAGSADAATTAPPTCDLSSLSQACRGQRWIRAPGFPPSDQHRTPALPPLDHSSGAGATTTPPTSSFLEHLASLPWMQHCAPTVLPARTRRRCPFAGLTTLAGAITPPTPPFRE